MEGIGGRGWLFIGALKLLSMPETISYSGHDYTHYRRNAGPQLRMY